MKDELASHNSASNKYTPKQRMHFEEVHSNSVETELCSRGVDPEAKLAERSKSRAEGPTPV